MLLSMFAFQLRKEVIERFGGSKRPRSGRDFNRDAGMSNSEHIQRVFEEGGIAIALAQAFRREIERKALLGEDVVVWRDNRVVVMQAKKLVKENGWDGTDPNGK